ncbi:glycosyltransferase family 4 protein [Heyndrickxia coagulans]|nr:glycosyltransferase family 4 protein [Heyndrickxia coagulans]
MGGVKTFYNNLIDYCLKNRYYVFLIFVSNSLDSEQIRKLRKNNVDFVVLNYPPYPNYFLKIIQNLHIVYLILRYSKQNRIDTIVFSQWSLLSDFLTTLLLLLRQKFVFFVHSTAKRPKKFKFLFNVINFIFRKLLRNNKVITVSEFNRKMIIENWSLNPSNVFVLYNYSNIPIIAHKNNNKTKIILTLGHIREYKNPELWLEIAFEITNQLHDVKFVWGGEGELLEKYKEKTKGNSSIEFIGYRRDVRELYENADIYLQLSKEETQGISVLDAMKSGIPCIVSDRGGLPESVINNYTGYVVNIEDKDLIMNKIKDLLVDKEKRGWMGKNSLNVYNQKFGLETWEKNLSNFL